MNKKITSIILSALIIVVILIIIFLLVPHKQNDQFNGYRYQDFINNGYSKEEITYLYTKLDESKLNIILKYQHLSNLKSLLEHKDFKSENLDSYLELQNKISLDLDDVIYIVNDGSYQEDISYNKFVISLIKEPYYLKNRLNRYIDYHDKKPDKKANQVIQEVNSNLDYGFYTNTKKTDISKETLMLVNKYYKLDEDYVPENLVTVDKKYGSNKQMDKTAYEAFKKMADDAKKQKLNLCAASPYRSYKTQKGLYNYYVKNEGQDKADTYSARAGYSEHQTGLAVDITATCNKSLNEFEKSKEFKWITKNCYKYGFILRYPKEKEYITGYMYEPWHYRYVGIQVAKEIYDKSLTFEEYYAYYIE